MRKLCTALVLVAVLVGGAASAADYQIQSVEEFAEWMTPLPVDGSLWFTVDTSDLSAFKESVCEVTLAPHVIISSPTLGEELTQVGSYIGRKGVRNFTPLYAYYISAQELMSFEPKDLASFRQIVVPWRLAEPFWYSYTPISDPVLGEGVTVWLSGTHQVKSGWIARYESEDPATRVRVYHEREYFSAGQVIEGKWCYSFFPVTTPVEGDDNYGSTSTSGCNTTGVWSFLALGCLVFFKDYIKRLY